MHIKIATRKSKLALIQTQLFIAKLKEHCPQVTYEIIEVVTTGDKITDKPLYDVGGKALFLKELEEKLLNHEADLAIHSLKDVPGIVSAGLEIAAVLEREDPRDCLVSYKYKSLNELPLTSIIGLSSVRRKVYIQKLRPDLVIRDLRGNVTTRIDKLRKGDYDAIILAVAGLKRLRVFAENFCTAFAVDEMIPAAGQGVIAVQKRINDKSMQMVCDHINHLPTWRLIAAERAFLAYFDASCKTPIAAYADYTDHTNQQIIAKYMYGDEEGKLLAFHTEVGKKTEGVMIAHQAARSILACLKN